MATKLPIQRFLPLNTRPSHITPSIPLPKQFVARQFSSSRALRNEQQPPKEKPNVVYSRPTTLGGADRKSSPLRIWPFVVILFGGFYAFNQLIKERSGTKPAEKSVRTEHPRG
jgi:hypothetical protein